MKIGMMSAWNTDSGTAIHAEAIGRAWRAAGHELTVFSHVRGDFHGTGFTAEDEDYVVRCFGTQKTGLLDEKKILSPQFDLFVIQDLRMLPQEKLRRILPEIRARSKTVNVLYENRMPEEKWFFEGEWSRAVYFDRRQEFFRKVWRNAEYIPFPCYPVREGKKDEARKRLSLPENKKIIYLFCQRGYAPFIAALPEKLRKKCVLLIVAQKGKSVKCGFEVIYREEEVLAQKRFDDYLFASDVVILHKTARCELAVVSSTAFQALGTLCPIMAPAESGFFVPFGDEVIKYSDKHDLEKKLTELVENPDCLAKNRAAVKSLAEKYSPERTASMFLNL